MQGYFRSFRGCGLGIKGLGAISIQIYASLSGEDALSPLGKAKAMPNIPNAPNLPTPGTTPQRLNPKP